MTNRDTKTALRAWRATDGEGTRFYSVGSVQEARALIEKLARGDLARPDVTWNAFGLEERGPDGEWYEWHDDQGRSVTGLEEAEKGWKRRP